MCKNVLFYTDKIMFAYKSNKGFDSNVEIYLINLW